MPVILDIPLSLKTEEVLRREGLGVNFKIRPGIKSLILELLASVAPLAQKLAKATFYYGAQADQRTGLFIETSASADISLTKDLNEGLTSMSYRRQPKFTGE